MHFFRFLVVLILGFIYVEVLNAQNLENKKLSNNEIEQLDKLVSKIVKKEKIVGLSYAIVGKNGILHQSAFGYSDKKNKKKTTPKTVFANGSISKLFTVTAIMQLYEQGKIDIENDIREYLPEFNMMTRFPVGLSQYTIKNILIHQSGLPSDYLSGLFNQQKNHFSTLVDDLQDEFQPLPSGVISTYSNVCFSLLGVLIEKVSGMTYEEYIKQNIFQPLEMTHAAFDLKNDEIKDKFSFGYKKNKQISPYTPTTLRATPAGSLVSNVESMAKFIQMYLNKGSYNNQQILSSKSIDQMWQHQNVNGMLDFDYKLGLTWRLGNEGQSNMIKAVPIRLHTGSTVLFCNILMILPEQELGIIVMENTARKNTVTNNLANEILKTYLSQKFNIKEEKGYLLKQEKKLSNELFNDLVGDYATNFGMINIRRKGKKLKADIINKNFKIKAYENNTFGFRLQLLGFIPIPIKNIDNMRLGLEKIDEKKVIVSHNLKGEKFYFGVGFENQNNDDIWQDKIGKYVIQNPNNDIQILYNMHLKRNSLGVYYLQFIPKLYENLPLRMPLHILNDKEAFIEGYSRWQGESIRFLDDKSFRYNGYTFIKEK